MHTGKAIYFKMLRSRKSSTSQSTRYPVILNLFLIAHHLVLFTVAEYSVWYALRLISHRKSFTTNFALTVA